MATKRTTRLVASTGQVGSTVVDVEGADYTVVSPLDHDHERYEPGATVWLTSEQAQLLSGVVVAIVSVVAAEPAPI